MVYLSLVKVQTKMSMGAGIGEHPLYKGSGGALWGPYLSFEFLYDISTVRCQGDDWGGDYAGAQPQIAGPRGLLARGGYWLCLFYHTCRLEDKLNSSYNTAYKLENLFARVPLPWIMFSWDEGYDPWKCTLVSLQTYTWRASAFRR